MQRLLTLFIATGTGLAAQNLASDKVGLMGSGYNSPIPFYVAPGQLVTLIANDSGTDGAICFKSPFSGDSCSVRAPGGADLPTTLAGVSFGFSGYLTTPPPVPILKVSGFEARDNADLTNTVLAAITVQIPFEAPPGGSDSPETLTAKTNGGVSQIDFYVYPDQVHILTGCDSFIAGPYAPGSSTGLPCPSIVTHADGSPVSASSPANPGEEVVAYAVGLGQTNPPLATGKLVAAAVPTATTFGLDFNYHPNALASKPLPSAPAPVYAGATPGYVGLYQVNFVVPPVPAGTPPCYVQPPSSTPRLYPNVVQSNLTVSVGGMSSFDGARICVAVPSP
ncbi:MAG TPA: hypothetical protein VN841_09580 [Bryobacteraceae bacterium]|nr:hypothetical protein [Bryobacteraceae bacterium]